MGGYGFILRYRDRSVSNTSFTLDRSDLGCIDGWQTQTTRLWIKLLEVMRVLVLFILAFNETLDDLFSGLQAIPFRLPKTRWPSEQVFRRRFQVFHRLRNVHGTACCHHVRERREHVNVSPQNILAVGIRKPFGELWRQSLYPLRVQ
jgi:hypothetical protein